MNGKAFRKGLLFCFLFVVLLWSVSQIFRWNLRKYGNDNTVFYSYEKDYIDVVFVGSSHSYCGFSPQILSEEVGLESYNFASSNQSMLANYLWAKEAYSHQKYDVSIVEAMSFPMSHGDLENDMRSLYSMKFSPYYYELALTYKRNAYKVLFPVFAFHNEWDTISKDLFVNTTKEYMLEHRGYRPLYSVLLPGTAGYVLDESNEERGYLKFTYVDKIREFCDKKGIQLIFAKTIMAPNDGNVWDMSYHNTVQDYAEQYDIPFIDFNMKYYREAAGLVIEEDIAEDLRHANDSGARKMTKYIGEFIRNQEILSNDI